jgi:predicted ATPase/class 3 adenylate cyclase/Tfp pilus assembly protein PilF
MHEGALTFLFSDIEGSTGLWEKHPDAMRTALRSHDALMREIIGSANGHVFKTVGDGFYAVFTRGADAVAAAVRAQSAIAAEPWPRDTPIKVRIALHTGVVEERDGDYFGQPVNRLARLLSTGHGGQTLVSQSVAEISRDSLPHAASLHDLGVHRLKDLAHPEHVFELRHAGLLQEFPPIKSLSTHPNNLPLQLTSFIGRAHQIREISELVRLNRLATLTGSGGNGKTRLALQVAAESLSRFPDGAWMVELGSIADAAIVPHAIAAALRVTERPGEAITQSVAESVGDKSLLILLDNCEHVLDACAFAAETLLRRCTNARILATSREPLGIGGEQQYRVPPLTRPDPAMRATADIVARSESVQLFIERASMVRPGFVITDHNARPLASICNKLDGIPLAIELAAARVGLLSVEEIDGLLDQRFDLLTSGPRTALPRQRTLRALIDWSYDLLTGAEQQLLRMLGVFSGSFAMDAVQVTCRGFVSQIDAIELLGSLANKSLVVLHEETEGRSRYRLLDTLRSYANEKLALSGDKEQLCERHRDYYLALAEDVASKLAGTAQAQWLARVEEDYDNYRSALDWCGIGPAVEPGLRLCAALHRFWVIRGHFSEGRAACRRMLAKSGADHRIRERADALHAAGVLAYYQSDYVAARSDFEESLSIRREIGDRIGVVKSLNSLGNVAIEQGDYDRARVMHEQSLAHAQELGDEANIANSLVNLGIVAEKQGDYAGATRMFESCLDIRSRLRDRWGMAVALNNLANVTYAQGNYAESRKLHEENLAIRRELKDRRGIALALGNLAELACVEGNAETARALGAQSIAIACELGDMRQAAHTLAVLGTVEAAFGNILGAARLWGAAEKLRESIGFSMPVSLSDDSEVAKARAAFGNDPDFDAAWQLGRALSLEHAVAMASAGMSTGPLP